jgi:DNA-binding IclR family transcriptional regulator
MQQQAINRALNIIEFVAQNNSQAVSFNNISKNMKLNTGTCANIIKALVQRGYLEKLDEKRGYILGKMVYKLANGDVQTKGIVDAAKPALEELTKQFNENAIVAILKDSSRYILHQTTSNHDVQANSPTYKHAYESATGRVLVAMLPDEEQNSFIEKYGLPKTTQWKAASSKTTFKQTITAIRANGYSHQETNTNIVGFAVPVMQQENAVAAISIYIPAYRLGNIDQQALIKALKKAAVAVERLLSTL